MQFILKGSLICACLIITISTILCSTSDNHESTYDGLTFQDDSIDADREWTFIDQNEALEEKQDGKGERQPKLFESSNMNRLIQEGNVRLLEINLTEPNDSKDNQSQNEIHEPNKITPTSINQNKRPGALNLEGVLDPDDSFSLDKSPRPSENANNSANDPYKTDERDALLSKEADRNQRLIDSPSTPISSPSSLHVEDEISSEILLISPGSHYPNQSSPNPLQVRKSRTIGADLEAQTDGDEEDEDDREVFPLNCLTLIRLVFNQTFKLLGESCRCNTIRQGRPCRLCLSLTKTIFFGGGKV